MMFCHMILSTVKLATNVFGALIITKSIELLPDRDFGDASYPTSMLVYGSWGEFRGYVHSTIASEGCFIGGVVA